MKSLISVLCGLMVFSGPALARKPGQATGGPTDILVFFARQGNTQNRYFPQYWQFIFTKREIDFGLNEARSLERNRDHPETRKFLSFVDTLKTPGLYAYPDDFPGQVDLVNKLLGRGSGIVCCGFEGESWAASRFPDKQHDPALAMRDSYFVFSNHIWDVDYVDAYVNLYFHKADVLQAAKDSAACTHMVKTRGRPGFVLFDAESCTEMEKLVTRLIRQGRGFVGLGENKRFLAADRLVERKPTQKEREKAAQIGLQIDDVRYWALPEEGRPRIYPVR